jgi:hypothetical protein
MLTRDLSGFDIALWGRFTHPEARREPIPPGWRLRRTFGDKPTPAAPEIGRGSDELIEIYER